MVEYCIEVDEKDNQIGLRAREELYGGKVIHRAVHLILFNNKNEMLLQLRARTKKVYPNLYTYSVDATVANESYEECIAREMQEEIGISVPVKRLFTFPLFDTCDKTWHCVFVGATNDPLTLDTSEIAAIQWASLETVKENILKEPEKYCPQFVEGMKRYFAELIDASKK